MKGCVLDRSKIPLIVLVLFATLNYPFFPGHLLWEGTKSQKPSVALAL